jgi:hypothetical protein
VALVEGVRNQNREASLIAPKSIEGAGTLASLKDEADWDD